MTSDSITKFWQQVCFYFFYLFFKYFSLTIFTIFLQIRINIFFAIKNYIVFFLLLYFQQKVSTPYSILVFR